MINWIAIILPFLFFDDHEKKVICIKQNSSSRVYKDPSSCLLPAVSSRDYSACLQDGLRASVRTLVETARWQELTLVLAITVIKTHTMCTSFFLCIYFLAALEYS